MRTERFCGRCGYGIVRPTPPERCPMCQQTQQLWLKTPVRVASARPADEFRDSLDDAVSA